MSAHRDVRCRGPYGGEGGRSGGSGCGAPAVFEAARHGRPPLRVCPVHLGPALLLGGGVLWPPGISMTGRP
ncbi:hypothetical protein QQY24_14560 [Streptomyces sp. TG1A-8]|uniref:hypothetical protein n=1 Tax=Streptomyces sp. TG1A-8 TaxID=3051385 RepID=UPI00265C2939|nr:hypothetical protein [Streptomyces sp. TG1A-8]MDO0926574.1 hypothetical protein [Streptomyces sp. TG1A-8]